MNRGDQRKHRDLLLTTLIDLLVQILFVFLLTVIVIAPKPETTLVVEQARQLAAESGRSLEEIKEMWRRLINADTLDQKQKQMLAEWANYERLKKLEQELRSHQKDLEKKAQELEKRFRALGDPPCVFADSAKNRPQPTFEVLMSDSGLHVRWKSSASREELVRELPVASNSLDRTLSVSEFQNDFRALFEKSRAAGCRHYVTLEDSSTSVSRSNAHRAAVEGYFYLMGAVTRRP